MKNIKNYLMSEAGISLVLVMTAIAFVSLGTLTIINLSKQNTTQSSSTRNTTFTELERKRISSILSGQNCVANFSGNSPNSPYTFLKLTSGEIFVQTTNSYYGGILRLDSIQTSLPGTPPVPTNTSTNTGVLTLSYKIVASPANYNRVGKLATIIQIPMYIRLDGAGKISECYAISENKMVGDAITQICDPVPSTNTNAYLTKINAPLADACTNSISFADSPAFLSTNCTLSGGANPTGKAFIGFDTNAITAAPDTGRQMALPYAKCSGFTSAVSSDTACATYQGVYTVSGGKVQCGFPGVAARDTTPSCAYGQMMNKTGSNTMTCLSMNCTAPNFISSISNAGPGCTPGPTNSCPAGYWARGFNGATGQPDCQPMPDMNGDCSVSMGATAYGISVSRDGAYNGTLNCSSLDLTKSCGGIGSTFMQSATPALGCATF